MTVDCDVVFCHCTGDNSTLHCRGLGNIIHSLSVQKTMTVLYSAHVFCVVVLCLEAKALAGENVIIQ